MTVVARTKAAPDVEDWRRRLDAYMTDRLAADPDGAHDVGHLRRVWRDCGRIAEAEGGADRLVLVAAAYLHDVVSLPKNAPDRHRSSALAAEAATAYLDQAAYPQAKIPAVAHAIVAHSYSAGVPPETLEAKILQDADRLESLGAMGIARTFYVSGLMGGRLFDDADPWAADRPLDDRRFALDHFETKLLQLPARMQTTAGRKLADDRVALMQTFLDGLRAELA